ncbi:unnamed protein product [Symbiodinium sp. CCMP2592]|nr:unnamed protein product [Symbiodinium sp. CCMP2592]
MPFFDVVPAQVEKENSLRLRGLNQVGSAELPYGLSQGHARKKITNHEERLKRKEGYEGRCPAESNDRGMKHCSKGLQRVSGRSVKDKTATSQREAETETPQKRVRAQSSGVEMSPAAPPDGELVEWDSLQPIRKSDDEEEVLPKQKSKEFDKGEKNEKNPPKPKKGRRDVQKVDVKKLLEGTEAESAKSVMESEAPSSSAAQPAQPIDAVPVPGSAVYNEAVQNLLNVLGSGGVTKEQVEYSLSRNIEQGMDLTQAADRAYTDLVCEGPSGQPNDAEADAAVEEGSEEEEEEQLPPIDLPDLIPQERRPPIPATPRGWQACWSTEHSTFYYYNEERKHSQWEWPLEGVPADMTDALLERLVTEIKSAAGCTEYKAKVALMETGFSHPAACTLLYEEQKMMEQEADERFQELKLGLKQMHRQQASVENFLEDLEYVCCESFVCHEEDVCLRVVKGERLKLYYQDPLEADYLKHAGEGWAYVGFKDNENTHGWIPQECMQVAVRPPKKRVQWQRYKVRESWAAQKRHDIDGFLRVEKGDEIEMLENLEAGACSWVYCFEVESGLAGEIPEHCLE